MHARLRPAPLESWTSTAFAVWSALWNGARAPCSATFRGAGTPPPRTRGPAARVPRRRCDLKTTTNTEMCPARRPDAAPGCRLDLCRPRRCGPDNAAARPRAPRGLRPRFRAAGRFTFQQPVKHPVWDPRGALTGRALVPDGGSDRPQPRGTRWNKRGQRHPNFKFTTGFNLRMGRHSPASHLRVAETCG